jgi:putative serine protease PepD
MSDTGQRDTAPFGPAAEIGAVEPTLDGGIPTWQPTMESEAHPHAARPAGHPPVRRGGGAGRSVAIAFVGMLIGGLIFAGGFVAATGLRTPGTGTSVTDIGDRDNFIETAAGKVVPSIVNVAVDSPTFSGVGSGIVIRSDGYIMTNFHVVENATRITVRLGASDVAATVVGTDPTTDIAVIHVSRSGLPAAKIGTSASLVVGQSVIAIGSPFGLDKTVTSGIVSALHRSDLQSGSNGGLTSYTNLIQTDAAINPGNSGGALADVSGAVVGMNTLIQSPSGTLGAAQSAGIGFAIPMDFAKPIADTLIAGGKVTHPYLGLSSTTVTPGIAQLYGLGASSGALVQSIAPGSPAAAARIRVGDIIVKFGDKTITTTEEVFAAVRASKVGTAIPVVVARGNKQVDLTVTLVAQ